MGKLVKMYINNNIKHAEIFNWTGQAIALPKLKIKFIDDWEEAKRPGVYFLFGIDEKTERNTVYIGEAEDVLQRLHDHNRNKEKDFEEIIFFTNKDDCLNKAHIKYLESRLIGLAQEAGRYIVKNAKKSNISNLSKGEKDAMEEFIGNIKILLEVLGHKVLKPLIPKNIDELNREDSAQIKLKLNSRIIGAEAYLTDEGIVVLQNSQAVIEIKGSMPPGYIRLREQLIEEHILKKEENNFVFSEDYLFKSPSQAACIILGSSVNGRDVWKTEKGLSLKDIEQ